MKDATYRRKRDTQKLQKHLKCPLIVTNKHIENQGVLNFSGVLAGMKT